MRIAIDTNLLVAALANPGGASARIVEAWRRGELEVVVSEATLREAELVLGGGWLARLRSRREVERLLDDLRRRSVWVEAGTPAPGLPLKDPGDARVLAAALAGGARYVVTTDREFLSHRGYGDVEFVTPDEFWQRWRREADG